MVIGYFSCCDAFTKGRIRAPGSCLPGGACACCGHEFPCSGRRAAFRTCRFRPFPIWRRQRQRFSRKRASPSSIRWPRSIRPTLFRQFPPKRLPRSRLRQGRSPHRPPSRLPKPPSRPLPRLDPTPDAPPPAPDVVQTAPTNVNVSVRVDSPGDNGSVEQMNAAAAAGRGRGCRRPPLSISRIRRSIRQPIPASATPTADPAPQTAAAEPAEAGDGWTWNWEWNCGDAIPDIPIPPEVGTQNWTWNWDWNCGDPESMPENTSGEKPPQYQPGATQYRPININISIRINSPGNDGNVSQTNVAVVLAAPALPKLKIAVPGYRCRCPRRRAVPPMAPSRLLR